MKKMLLYLLVFLVSIESIAECTTLIVGKKASADGSIMMARNEDYKASSTKRLFMHSKKNVSANMNIKSPANDFRIKLREPVFKYFAMCDPGDSDILMEEVGINSQGLAITSTETLDNSDKVLKVDPYVTKTGIGEAVIPALILSQCKTPREAVEKLGQLIEKYGASEGYGVGFADSKEAWYLETASGHRWCAVRIPDNSYFIAANQSRIQIVDISDGDNCLASPGLIDFAVKNKLYSPEQDGKFNFRKSFSRIADDDIKYNYYRIWTVMKIFNPDFKTDYSMGDFPMFMVPEKKISLNDVKDIMRNHYQGTFNDPYITRNPKEFFRPISVFRTVESHVLHMRPWLPADIGNVAYIAMGMPTLSIYVPFYQGISEVPKAYSVGGEMANNGSAYWTYRKLQTLGMTDFPEYGPYLKNKICKYEALQQHRMNEFEKEYNDSKSSQDEQVSKLDQFTKKEADSGLNEAERLTDIIFTQKTKEIDEEYSFSGS